MFEFICDHYNYWAYIGLMMIGFYAMMTKRNLMKKVIGMNVFQSAILFFYISIAAKDGATVPILEHAHNGHGYLPIDVTQYVNPLPHVLMLTAIVVMVATLGLALAVIILVYRRYNTLEEDDIIMQLKRG